MKRPKISITISIDQVHLKIPGNSIPDAQVIKSIKPELIALIQKQLKILNERIQNENN